MRHIRVLVPVSERDRITARLKTLQAIHVEVEAERPEAILSEQMQRVDAAGQALKDFMDSHSGSTPMPKAQDADAFDLMALLEKRSDIARNLGKREKDVLFWRKWGAVRPERLSGLTDAGIDLRIFRAKEKDLSAFDFPENAWVFPVFEEDGIIHFALLSQGRVEKVPFDEIGFPRRNERTASDERQRLAHQLQRVDADIDDIPDKNDLLSAEKKRLQLEFDHQKVRNGFAELVNTPVLSISGWCTKAAEASIQSALDEEVCSYRFRDPKTEDDVPVLLKNSAYNRLFEPITKIFQLPSYYEFDLTPFIAVFYPILFAYCLGDAGYGLVLSAAALGLIAAKGDWTNGLLGLVLGLSTTVVGLIKSGSVFGIPTTAGSDIGWVNALAPLVIIPDDTRFLWNAFNVALIIGLVQILLGLLIAVVKAWVYKGFVASISFFGKLFIVIGAVSLFLLGNVESSPAYLDTLAQLLLYTGIGLVALFHDMSVRLLPRVAGSVLPLFFIFTGLLGDVLSYVRLFALGVASAVLGLVVNQIGGQMYDNGGAYAIGAVLFLLFGHGLNFALAALGSFVHPLRLTFVEFYNNAQFEGGGKPFKAFGTTSND